MSSVKHIIIIIKLLSPFFLRNCIFLWTNFDSVAAHLGTSLRQCWHLAVFTFSRERWRRIASTEWFCVQRSLGDTWTRFWKWVKICQAGNRKPKRALREKGTACSLFHPKGWHQKRAYCLILPPKVDHFQLQGVGGISPLSQRHDGRDIKQLGCCHKQRWALCERWMWVKWN